MPYMERYCTTDTNHIQHTIIDVLNGLNNSIQPFNHRPGCHIKLTKLCRSMNLFARWLNTEYSVMAWENGTNIVWEDCLLTTEHAVHGSFVQTRECGLQKNVLSVQLGTHEDWTYTMHILECRCIMDLNDTHHMKDTIFRRWYKFTMSDGKYKEYQISLMMSPRDDEYEVHVHFEHVWDSQDYMPLMEFICIILGSQRKPLMPAELKRGKLPQALIQRLKEDCSSFLLPTEKCYTSDEVRWLWDYDKDEKYEFLQSNYGGIRVSN